MNLSPQIYNKCAGVLQSKEQEKARLEANVEKLILKHALLNHVNNILSLYPPGSVADFHFNSEDPYDSGVQIMSLAYVKSDRVQIQGYPIVINTNQAAKLVDILSSQPMFASQPL